MQQLWCWWWRSSYMMTWANTQVHSAMTAWRTSLASVLQSSVFTVWLLSHCSKHPDLSCVAVHLHCSASDDSVTGNSHVNNEKQHGCSLGGVQCLFLFCAFVPPQNDRKVAHVRADGSCVSVASVLASVWGQQWLRAMCHPGVTAAQKTSPLCIDLTPETHWRLELVLLLFESCTYRCFFSCDSCFYFLLQQCPSTHNLLTSLRQVEKMLAVHEASYQQGLRALKKKISALHNSTMSMFKKNGEKSHCVNGFVLFYIGSCSLTWCWRRLLSLRCPWI